MKTLRIVVGVLAACGLVAWFALGWSNRLATERWLASPPPPGQLVAVDGESLYATILGEGDPTVIVFEALGAVSPEWWKVQRQLATHARVVTWDRPGIAWSAPSAEPPSAKRAAALARTLMDSLGIAPPYILVGHSLGGLIAERFARDYPSDVAGVILIDPAVDKRLWTGLVDDKTYRTFIDKAPLLKRIRPLASLGATRFVDLAPRGLTADARGHWKHAYANRPMVDAMKAELAALDGDFDDLKDAPPFPEVPLWILYHTPKRNVEEMERFHASNVVARNTEAAWEALIRKHYWGLSPLRRWIVADSSGHAMHLEEPQLVVNTAVELLDTLEQERNAQALQAIRTTRTFQD